MALLVALVSSGVGQACVASPAAYIPIMQSGDTMPAIPLVAQDGRAFDIARFRGEALAVSFIYTRCGDPRMCPLVSAKFARAQSAIGPAPIHLVTITLDPTFDTPAVLTRYGRALGQDPRRWTLGTGSTAAVEEFAGRLGIATSQIRPGLIVHTEGVAFIGPDGRLARTIYGNDWTVAEIVAGARATLPGTRDPLADVRAWLSSALERCGGGNVALGGTALLGFFLIALAAVGSAFWFAFRTKIADEASSHR